MKFCKLIHGVTAEFVGMDSNGQIDTSMPIHLIYQKPIKLLVKSGELVPNSRIFCGIMKTITLEEIDKKKKKHCSISDQLQT